VDPDILKIAQLAAIAVMTGGGVVARGGVTRWINSRTSRSVRDAHQTPIDDARLERLEAAVESIAVEGERIGESQRFTAKLMADRAQEQLPRRG